MKSALLAVVLLVIVTLIRITFGQSTGDLRLVNGVTRYEGRVEVYSLGQWGTICDDQFDIRDANVICKQLGFTKAVRAHGRAKYGQGSGPILMDGLNCNGRESRVNKCHFNGWGVHDCGHNEDAGVECQAPPRISPNVSDVRLICPPTHPRLQNRCKTCTKKTGCSSISNNFGVQGVIEVYRNNKWYLLSGQSWDIKAAKVVCGQLGYPHLIEIPGLEKLHPSHNCSSKQAMKNLPFCRIGVAKFNQRLNDQLGLTITCNGNEGDLNQCTTEVSSSTNVTATVHCGYLTENSDKCGKNDPRKELYRLRGGPVPWIGRVEVRKNGKWGTICDLGWSIEDANIVCRNLGYGTAKKIFSRAHFGRGSADVVFSNLKCRGTEINLSRCKSTTDIQLAAEVQRYCYQNSGDAGVECKTVHPRCKWDEQQSRLESNGLVQIKGSEGWGRVCFGVLDLMDAQVICRENQQKFAARIISVPSKLYPPSSLLYSGYYQCKGDELYLKECKKSLNTFYRCVNITRIDCVSGLPDLVPNVKRFQYSLGYRYVDRLPMYYLTCALEEKCLASDANYVNNPNQLRSLFRFDSLTMNFGTAAFEPHRPSSEWQWHACHQHYHSFEAFINYDVLDTQRRKVAEGHKASFCLEDSFCHTGGYPQYRCSTGRQGISVNCGDLYARHLDCQWIDITGLSPGTYIVRQAVNADHLVAESDYENNIIECTISLYSTLYYTLHNCTHSDHD